MGKDNQLQSGAYWDSGHSFESWEDWEAEFKRIFYHYFDNDILYFRCAIHGVELLSGRTFVLQWRDHSEKYKESYKDISPEMAVIGSTVGRHDISPALDDDLKSFIDEGLKSKEDFVFIDKSGQEALNRIIKEMNKNVST